MAYAPISFTAFEVPTAAKWNILGTNDAEFNSMIKHNGTIVEVSASGDTSIDIPVNNIPLRQDDPSGTPQNLAFIDSSDILQLGDTDLSGAAINGVSVIRASWTPTVANLTVGNGTLVARYNRIDKQVYCHIKFVLGSTSAMGSLPTFTLPVASAHTAYIVGAAFFHDIGTATYSGVTYIEAGGTAGVRVSSAGGTYVGLTAISSTVPHTWANTDELHLVFMYEAA